MGKLQGHSPLKQSHKIHLPDQNLRFKSCHSHRDMAETSLRHYWSCPCHFPSCHDESDKNGRITVRYANKKYQENYRMNVIDRSNFV